MDKKLTLGLFALLFVTSGVQSLAISKIQADKTARNVIVASNSSVNQNDNIFENQKASVISIKKTENILLEAYLKSKYPKDYNDKLIRINSKIKNLLHSNNISDSNDLIQKSIFHRILCGIMGGNYYQEYMGGGAYCARLNAALPYAYSTGNNIEDSEVFLNGTNEIKNTTSAEYLKSISIDEVEKIATLSSGILGILEEEGVDINALGGPGFRRFLCKLFGGNWQDGVVEIGEATVWIQSCTW